MEIKLAENKNSIRAAQDVAEIFDTILKSEDEIDREKEHFWVIGLDAQNIIKYIELVSLGTLNSCLVHPREVFRLAILKAVAGIIILHNHPSGNVSPSNEDINVKERIKQAGEIIGITLMDSIIISGTGKFASII